MPFDLSYVSPSVRSGDAVFQNIAITHTHLEIFWLWGVLVIFVAVFYSWPESFSALLMSQWDMEAAKQVTYIVWVNNNMRIALTKRVRFESECLLHAGVCWHFHGWFENHLGARSLSWICKWVSSLTRWIHRPCFLIVHFWSMSIRQLVFIYSHLRDSLTPFGLWAEDSTVIWVVLPALHV